MLVAAGAFGFSPAQVAAAAAWAVEEIDSMTAPGRIQAVKAPRALQVAAARVVALAASHAETQQRTPGRRRGLRVQAVANVSPAGEIGSVEVAVLPEPERFSP